MAKYTLQELPEELTDGKKVVFPKMQNYSLHDYETVIKHMRSYVANFSDGSIRAVFDALVSVMESWMPLGHSIKIDGLGVFSLSLGFDGSASSEKALSQTQDGKDGEAGQKAKYRHICIKGINFKPDPQLLKELNRQTDFDRTQSGVVVPRKSKLTDEERLAKAQALIKKYGFMTLSDYARATGLCRTVASKDLKRMVADATSGITTRGAHSHKVWVASED